MNAKLVAIAVVMLAAGTGMLGSLYFFADAGSTTVSISGGTITAEVDTADWTGANLPEWSPIEDTVTTVDGGGLATIKVPASSPSTTWRVTVFLTDPDLMVAAYSYLNMCVKMNAAADDTTNLVFTDTTFQGATALEDYDGDGVIDDADCVFLAPENGFVTFQITASDGTLADGSTDSLSGADDVYAFTVGIDSGSMFLADASASDLSPDFRIDVEQG